MSNVQQQQVGSGSNRIAAINVDGTTPSPNNKTFDDPNHQKPGWRKFLTFVGPGFLVSLAYLDPGNLETDLQAGANHRFELLWVVLIGMIFALIIQSLAANLGVSTGNHLSELCKAEYPIFVKYCLCLLAELAVIAADIPEVIGTAFALNILFSMPVWIGVFLTGLSTLLLLGLQRYGINQRGENVDQKIKNLDAELSRYREQIKKTRPGPAQEAIKARAMWILKQK